MENPREWFQLVQGSKLEQRAKLLSEAQSKIKLFISVDDTLISGNIVFIYNIFYRWNTRAIEHWNVGNLCYVFYLIKRLFLLLLCVCDLNALFCNFVIFKRFNFNILETLLILFIECFVRCVLYMAAQIISKIKFVSFSAFDVIEAIIGLLKLKWRVKKILHSRLLLQ